MKITEHEMLVTLATMALKMDDLTGHDVVEAFRELGYGAVIDEARAGVSVPGVGVSLSKKRTSITRITAEPVDSWRKCQLSFKVPQDAAVVGHELDASEGASILSGCVLESVRPVLQANQDYLIRIANGRLPQHVSLTLILEKP